MKKIYFVGDIMIDSLFKNLETSRNSNILEQLKLTPKEYAALTLHRPSNVDTKENLSQILDAIKEIAKNIKIVFPIHPRTKKNAAQFKLSLKMDNLILIPPTGYLDFIHLEENAKFILTDSGSIQGETTVLGIPCLTLRENTERPVTTEMGTNLLVGTSKSRIVEESLKILNGNVKHGEVPPLWDGHTAERIGKVLNEKL